MGRKLFIHCGLHKTGTTAVQNAFRKNARALRRKGLLYPETGIPGQYSGHHHIAWQLCRDRRFDPRCGSISAVLAEIEPFEGNSVLSSEDFESSILHPGRWQKFLGKVRPAGIQPVFVIYLRDPIEYLESLYLENLKHGFGEEFSSVARKVSEAGKLNLHEWEFCFAYTRIRESLSTLPGVEVILRNYHALSGGSAVSDFADVVGIPPTLLRGPRGKNRPNERDPLETSLGLFTGNRAPKEEPLKLREAALGVVVKLCRGLPATLVTPHKLRKLLTSGLAGSFGFADAGSGSNLASFPRGVQKRQREGTENDKQAGLNIARIFSFETDLLIRKLATTTVSAGATRTGREMKGHIAHQARQWRKWVSEDIDRE